MAHSTLLSWSGGKDSCLVLWELQRRAGSRVEALVTTVTRDYDRISMHGVRCELLQRQAENLGLPLYTVSISKGCSNADYEAEMGRAFAHFRGLGVQQIAFGDLFLEDIRAYRQKLLDAHSMQGLYPLWGRDTAQLVREFIDLGFKSVVVCVDPAKLDPGFAGRIIDEAFLADLPKSVDPCGENGEFHSFVFDGPCFTQPVRFTLGETACRESFWFRDLLPQA
ncbi:MAG TPA: diphthine--ammonia ligase [Gammaproteobacteria bacterium]